MYRFQTARYSCAHMLRERYIITVVRDYIADTTLISFVRVTLFASSFPFKFVLAQ